MKPDELARDTDRDHTMYRRLVSSGEGEGRGKLMNHEGIGSVQLTKLSSPLR
jgi:hypothetical protein